MSKKPPSILNTTPSKLKKIIAFPPQPSRVCLQNELNGFHANTNYDTPVKEKMTTVIIQNHHKKLAQYHQDNVASNVPTPNTKSFLYSAQHLVNVGSESIVQDRDKVLNEIAQSYLSRGAKKARVGDFIIHRPQSTAPPPPASHSLLKVPPVPGCTARFNSTLSVPTSSLACTFPIPGSQMFGGELPSNSEGKRERKSGWHSLERRVCNSFFTAVAEFGPNTKALKSEETRNGFKVSYYCCREKDCQYRTRVFYPLSIDSQIIPSKNTYQLLDVYVGPVISQIKCIHSCNKRLSWQLLLLQGDSRIGLHPILKDAVDREGNMDRYKLPRPDKMLRRIREQYACNVDTLFPGGCLSIVCNQIKVYWRGKRKKLLKDGDPERILVQYLPDIQTFFLKHTLVIPRSFMVVSYIPTVQETCLFAEKLFLSGTNSVLYKKSGSPDSTQLAVVCSSTRTAEHEMICLAIPSLEDPDYGSIVLKATEKDDSSGPNKAQDHIVVFSSMNLLRQYTIVYHDYGNMVMACIDSTHAGGDSSGGKLMSFGIVSHLKNGNKGSDYRHGYIPLVMARVLEENQESALFMLSALGKAVRDLFGLKLEFKGGLISDHANSFVNAYINFFPDCPRGQCFPHVLLKVKDQRGRRKRGSPGYLSYNKTRKNLKVATKDVKNMHRCKTEKLKEKYTELSLKCWRQPGKDNESPMANVFDKSYVQSLEHSRYRYNLFGYEGDSPQCNSLERFHLSAKGSRQFDGFCQFGMSPDEMLNYQYPKLIFHVSSRVESFVKSYRISDETACKADSELKKLVCKLSLDIDRFGPDEYGGYFYNNRGFEGTPIDAQRMCRYKLALEGVFPSEDYSKRQELFDAANGLAYVIEKPGIHGSKVIMCDCVRFWKSTACQHAYHFKWGSPELLGKKQKKKGVHPSLKDSLSPMYRRGEYAHKTSGFIKE